MSNDKDRSDKESESQKRASAAKHARAADEAAASATKKAAEEKAPLIFAVMPGKSLATCRGIVDSGNAVTALDFCKFPSQREEGQKRLDELVTKGYVQKR